MHRADAVEVGVQAGKRLEGKHVDAYVGIAVEPLIESGLERADCGLGEQARLLLAEPAAAQDPAH